jgi:hypothetical protein
LHLTACGDGLGDLLESGCGGEDRPQVKATPEPEDIWGIHYGVLVATSLGHNCGDAKMVDPQWFRRRT